MANPYDSLNLFDLSITTPSERYGRTSASNQQQESEESKPPAKPSSGVWKSARVQRRQKENETLNPGPSNHNREVRTQSEPRPEPSNLVPGPYNGPLKTGPALLVRDYLRAQDPVFKSLDDLRDKGWKNPAGDTHFRNLQTASDNANLKTREAFYEKFKTVGQEMHKSTNVFNVNPPLTTTTGSQTLTTISHSPREPPNALNLCMAPGGYTWAFLQQHPDAHVCGITLPENMGGHPMLLPHSLEDPRVEVQFLDLTMLATEYGVPLSEIPTTHPEHNKFTSAQPFTSPPQGFSLVMCDGQVLRTHERASCRQELESKRLTTAQLILGLQRIREGGTLVILLHKVDAWDTVLLLRAFDSFSDICLFKPTESHMVRSSFYLIAKRVRCRSKEAEEAVRGWKEGWWKATFGGVEGMGVEVVDDELFVKSVIEEYGERLVSLGRPVWRIQRDALRKAEYAK
ncbi:MAG: hypothetical protein M1812_002719 [Candelaria pacifica]|nr:MAG: hypothetical protein M1812_002719 [Candelaria pacifica]